MRRKILLFAGVLALMLLSGCAIRTVDQMYQLPKRSEAYNNLQTAINEAMVGLEYCAPVSGEYQQTVQMADLDGDGGQEYLLFAKGGAEHPLKILIFQERDKTYAHTGTIECSGAAFDQVFYAQMDDKSGLELVVGRRLSDQVLRTVSVYTFSGGEPELVTSAGYTRFLMVDLQGTGKADLFVLAPGQEETDRGVACLYSIRDGVSQRSVEVNMSEPISELKRILVGRLFGGQTAVYVASAVETTAIITDVFAVTEGILQNVTFSNESGTSVQTIRNYYIYADDIDGDGETELPALLSDVMPLSVAGTGRNDLLRWYSMTPEGKEVDKLFTFHNFDGGWYLELPEELADRILVERIGSEFGIFLHTEESKVKLLTVFTFTGQSREDMATEDGRFLLKKTDTTVFAASVTAKAGDYGITENDVINAFHLISSDWNTGEV